MIPVGTMVKILSGAILFVIDVNNDIKTNKVFYSLSHEPNGIPIYVAHEDELEVIQQRDPTHGERFIEECQKIIDMLTGSRCGDPASAAIFEMLKLLSSKKYINGGYYIIQFHNHSGDLEPVNIDPEKLK